MTLDNWVIVFDLDDTLVSEAQYHLSGIRAVEALISSTFDVSFYGKIKHAFNSGVSDIWAWSCTELGLPLEVKTSLMWCYRLHKPDISLLPGISSLLDILFSSSAHVAIITDGRSVTQRLKLKALGLDTLHTFISEDFNSTKPCPKRFIAVEHLWPNCRFVYIADNPAKDFLAPNSRGWLTLGADWVDSRIHVRDDAHLDHSYQPSCWLYHPSEVIDQIYSS